MQVHCCTLRVLLLVLTLLTEASAHGQLTVPRPRPDGNGNAESYLQREPVFTIDGPRVQYSSNSMRCHDFAASAEKSTITAGANLALTWTFEAAHPGDCYVYISYDGADPVNFFKIAEFLGCGAANGLSPPNTVTETIQIPAELPPCDHCVLRWEWTAHQQVTNIEFYVQCADVQIVSNAGPTKPTPVTAISGIEHLPASASSYRDVYNTQPSENMLVGPDLATYTSCVAGTAGCISGTATGGGAATMTVTTGMATTTSGIATTAGIATTVSSTTSGTATTAAIATTGSSTTGTASSGTGGTSAMGAQRTTEAATTTRESGETTSPGTAGTTSRKGNATTTSDGSGGTATTGTTTTADTSAGGTSGQIGIAGATRGESLIMSKLLYYASITAALWQLLRE